MILYIFLWGGVFPSLDHWIFSEPETHKISKRGKKKSINLKLFVFKNILGLNGVKVAAVFIGGMPGLQSVSGWLPARDTHKPTTHTHTHTRRERKGAPTHTVRYLLVSVAMETDRPPIERILRCRCECAPTASGCLCGGGNMCFCISEFAVFFSPAGTAMMRDTCRRAMRRGCGCPRARDKRGNSHPETWQTEWFGSGCVITEAILTRRNL